MKMRDIWTLVSCFMFYVLPSFARTYNPSVQFSDSYVYAVFDGLVIIIIIIIIQKDRKTSTLAANFPFVYTNNFSFGNMNSRKEKLCAVSFDFQFRLLNNVYGITAGEVYHLNWTWDTNNAFTRQFFFFFCVFRSTYGKLA